MRVEAVNLRSDGRPQYRLGDAVIRRDKGYGRAALQMVARAESFFEGTILYEYARRIDRDSDAPQWGVLADVVRRKARQLEIDGPRKDELVAHLRLGNDKGYVRTAAAFVDYVTGILDGLWPVVSTVSVVTAIHFGATYLDLHGGEKLEKTSADHRNKVREIMDLFAARETEARLISHADVDTDFCYLANSEVLVLGNGHFSLCGAMISDAVIFVPPWARSGTDLDIDELLRSRDPASCISNRRARGAQRSVSC